MEYSILANKEDLKQIEEEEKNLFIKSVLDNLDVPIENIWPENNLLDAKNKRDLYFILGKLCLNIVNDGDHGLKIYHEEREEIKEKNGQTRIQIKSVSLIAQWFRPVIIMKKELIQPDPRKKYFFQMNFKYESVFEEGD